MTVDLAPAYSAPSTYGGPAGRVHHGYSTAKADLTDIGHIAAGGTISNAWYAKLEPGGFIVPHVDQGPWLERWHYPISGVGYVWADWDLNGQPYRSHRYWNNDPYRMNHHLPHAVWNPRDHQPDEPRVILIVEYDNPVDQPTTDLILAPMIPQIQELIDAV